MLQTQSITLLIEQLRRLGV